MEQQALAVNMLLKDVNDSNKIDRILWISHDNKYVFIINIFDNQWARFVELHEILYQISNNEIDIYEKDPMLRVIIEENISEDDKKIRDKAWKIVSTIIATIPAPRVFSSKERKELVKELSYRFSVSRNTIDEYLKRYWKRGNSPNALLPDYYKCGAAGHEKVEGKIKRGRPRKFSYELGQGLNIDEDIKKIFRISINKYYYNSKKNSLATTYQLMVRDFFTEDYKIKDGLRIPIVKDSNDIPTLEQFRYWFNKERNIKKEISKRYGAKIFEQKNRAVLGSSLHEAIGPASTYEIDASVLDAFLCSRYNRSWIIGRGVIYAVIDRFSKMVMGVNVSLEGPSWIGAMGALYNSMTDKVSFCKEYGIDISSDMWASGYLPETILADRGELEGYNVETLVKNFGIRVQNTPSFRPEWKATVEQYFRLVFNMKVKPFIPGTISQDFRERGARDYRLDAKLDLAQMTAIIIKCALYHNTHYLKNYNREELMIEDDIEPVPIKIWNWGIRNRMGKLRTMPEELIKLNLMPHSTATVTEKGIRFKGMLYGSEKALREKWFEIARKNGNYKIDVSYEPRNLNYIYIIIDNGRNFEKCFLLKHQERYLNKSIEEIEYLLQKESLDLKSNFSSEMQKKIDLMSEIESIVNVAEQLTNKVKIEGKSDASRIKGIRLNRSIEKSINRNVQAFELNKREFSESEVLSFDCTKNEVTDANEDINILKRKQKERKKKSDE